MREYTLRDDGTLMVRERNVLQRLRGVEPEWREITNDDLLMNDIERQRLFKFLSGEEGDVRIPTFVTKTDYFKRWFRRDYVPDDLVNMYGPLSRVGCYVAPAASTWLGVNFIIQKTPYCYYASPLLFFVSGFLGHVLYSSKMEERRARNIARKVEEGRLRLLYCDETL
jgi:hypothetical protein